MIKAASASASLLVLAVLCAAAPQAASLTAAQAASPQARPANPPQVAPQVQIPVSVTPPEVDFGVVAPGTKHRATFTLRNLGNQPLTIERAAPSCKCTDITPVDGKTIQPGGTLEFSATLQVPKTPGDKDAKVMITFAGIRNAMVLAKMKGDVTLPIRTAPAYLAAQQGVTSGTVQLASVDGKPFKVLSAGGKPAQVTDAAAAGEEPFSKQTLSWSLAGVPVDQLQEWWIVETDRPECALIPLRVRHETTGSLFDKGKTQRCWFVPESVVVAGRVKPGQTSELTAAIEHLPPRPGTGVDNPQWSTVTAMRAPADRGTAELVSATLRGTDFVDIVFKYTPAAGMKGVYYVPVDVVGATGVGKVYVAVTVDG